ncbi:helix-turn-helix transcriptional regulator [Micromonospora sp. 4G57]|uniref:Helix-turn-helix transcriptional regulator n=1 Tax=Micromonospora sicca TaxID=2202420 RepID=A0ABU5JN53_9ACTN|nr:MULTISPECIES: helix-turn-helix transcriptional regulator [unclassified Micromonospora]MDZ5447383.1 helix-turn-helix transcriptional regulator [Micromonospora sp. 4G57]MDZ5494052.1 helix-turn-helix transcriptional regulator [Micromonospora sp. 4G53]
MTGTPPAGTGPAAFSDIDVHPPVSLAGPHLLDADLLAPTGWEGKHLAECGWCQQRQSAAEQHRHDGDLDDEEFLRTARQRAEAGGAAELTPITRLTPQLHALTLDTDGREDVAVGQLWRLRWEQANELAVVIAVDRWRVTVAPVTTDIAAADEFSLLLPPSASPLNIALAVCLSLECTVPMFVLDRQIAPASRPTTNPQQAAAQLPPPQTLHDVWRAWRRSTAGPAGLTYGTALDEGDLDRRELRAVIASSFAPLVGASATIPGVDPLGEVVPLAQRVRDRGLRPAALAQATGLSLEVFTRINRGGRVKPAEAAKLAAVLDTDTRTVLDANPALDDDLITEVSQPRHRPALRRLARVDGTDEDQQRWAIAEAVSPTAARTVAGSGQRADPRATTTHWAEKVDHYLRRRLAELDETGEAQP